MLVILHQFFWPRERSEKKLNDTDPVSRKKGK